MDDVLILKGVTKSFGDLSILRGIDLTLGQGETLSVMGPSGIGKSTLLHIAGLMDRPTSGDLILNNHHVADLADSQLARLRLNIVGFLFQFHYLLGDMTVLENVLVPSRIACDDLNQKEQLARQLLEKMGLSKRFHHYPDQLSGGEQQRVALARALIRTPKILLCDEPTGNLDKYSAGDVLDLIFHYVEVQKMSAIFVTHNDELAHRAGRSYVLSDGILKGN